MKAPVSDLPFRARQTPNATMAVAIGTGDSSTVLTAKIRHWGQSAIGPSGVRAQS